MARTIHRSFVRLQLVQESPGLQSGWEAPKIVDDSDQLNLQSKG